MQITQYPEIGGKIEVEAMPAQERLVKKTEWHLEAFPGDGDRLRVVIDETGETGPWFSRRWVTLKFSQFWPA